jgi:hypothetical protein
MSRTIKFILLMGLTGIIRLRITRPHRGSSYGSSRRSPKQAQSPPLLRLKLPSKSLAVSPANRLGRKHQRSQSHEIHQRRFGFIHQQECPGLNLS